MRLEEKVRPIAEMSARSAIKAEIQYIFVPIWNWADGPLFPWTDSVQKCGSQWWLASMFFWT